MRCLGLNPTENEIVSIMADLDVDCKSGPDTRFLVVNIV